MTHKNIETVKRINFDRLLGHSEKEITERVYRRLGEVVRPTK